MIYVYQCTECGLITEREFPMGEQPPEVDCARCQLRGLDSPAPRRFLAPTVIYQGSGWTGASHGIPDMDEREKLPGPLEFDDLLEE